jgi:phytanoyl-CoA hydroxylase
MTEPGETAAAAVAAVVAARRYLAEECGLDVSFAEQFHRDGCAVVRGFASEAECEGMMARMRELIAAWDPMELVVFRTDSKQVDAQAQSDYFLNSGDGIAFFLEPAAVDEKTGALADGVPKEEALNKVGHGLHMADPVFRAYSTSRRVAALTRLLGWVSPVLPQSMYIFKQPHRGAEVTSHQDATFLFTTPRQTCLGLWLALEDATLDNGCVWARPGSHVEPLRRHFQRNPAHFEQGDAAAPQMIFRNLFAGGLDQTPAPWEGALPPGTPEDQAARAAGFVPFECKRGDLVLIHGQVDHLSLKNTSAKSRHTFQLHLVEGPSEGVVWHPQNWLQLSGGRAFLPL